MRRSDEGPRLYGPYEHGRKWHVQLVTGRGKSRKTRYRLFETRAEANAYIESGRDAAQGTTVRQAVDAFLERGRSRELAATTLERYEHHLWRLLGCPRTRTARSGGSSVVALSSTQRARTALATHTSAADRRPHVGTWCVSNACSR